MTLEQIRRVKVPSQVIEKTQRALNDAGDQGYELFVLWSGEPAGDEVTVSTAHVPEQTSYQTSDGLLVRVEGQALHELNSWLFEAGESLVAQVHAHPTDAFHSSTDDTYPIVTTLGGLSVVVPDFARRGVLTRGTVAYRLGSCGWTRLSRRGLRKLLTEVDG